MPERVALNKSTLARKRGELKLLRRVVPSLDLKRRQLMGECARARAQLVAQEERLEALFDRAAAELPMLAVAEVRLEGIVRVHEVVVAEENVVGVRLPTLVRVELEEQGYPLLTLPAWVDGLVPLLQQTVRSQAELEVARERLRRLQRAQRRIAQRVNLFDKILIPDAEQSVRRIGIFLADAERSQVVRSKIAKRRHAAGRERGTP